MEITLFYLSLSCKHTTHLSGVMQVPQMLRMLAWKGIPSVARQWQRTLGSWLTRGQDSQYSTTWSPGNQLSLPCAPFEKEKSLRGREGKWKSEKPGKLIHRDMVGEHIGPTSNLKIMAKPFLSPSASKCGHTHTHLLSSEFGSAVINKHVLRKRALSKGVTLSALFFQVDFYAFQQENKNKESCTCPQRSDKKQNWIPKKTPKHQH